MQERIIMIYPATMEEDAKVEAALRQGQGYTVTKERATELTMIGTTRAFTRLQGNDQPARVLDRDVIIVDAKK